MQIETLKREVINELPQIPFILDQVGEAIKWAEESFTDGKLIKVLTVGAQVAKWVSKISEPNFYKTYLVIAALIVEIPNVLDESNFEKFKSTSNAVEATIKAISVDSETTDKRGCFNTLTIHLVQLAKENEEALAIMLFGILNDIKEVISGIKEVGEKSPITPQDYITTLGYALVMANIRMSNLNLLEYNRVLINDIEVILNNDVIY